MFYGRILNPRRHRAGASETAERGGEVSALAAAARTQRAGERRAGGAEAQAGIRIAGRNINNLRYADDTTLMAENEEELKSLLMKVKEE